MIVNISWIQFQQHFLRTDKLVFVKEHSESWTVYCSQESIIISSVVQKSEVPEENFAFVDRYLNEQNIISVDFVKESESVKLRLIQDVL